MFKNLIITICLFSIGFLIFGCQQQRDETINRMGPEVNAAIVIIFKKETTHDEISDFQRTVISTPVGTSGFKSLPGIMTGVGITRFGFRGEAINFKPRASLEEKEFVKKRILESPIVHKIFENVVPDEIKIEDLQN